MLEVDGYGARLEAGLESLGLPVDGQVVDRLLGWLALHERWSRAFNLTGAQAPEVLIDGHLLDCAAIHPALPLSGALYDVGSGSGLPGLVLAALAPERSFILVESLGKRVRFLEQAIAELKLQHVMVEQSRAEAVAFDPAAAGILVRAVAPLEKLCRLLAAPLQAGGRLLAMKGDQWTQEWAPLEGRFHLEARYAYQVPGYDQERVLLTIRAGEK